MPRLRWWILLSLVSMLLVLVRVYDVHLALVGGVIAMSDSLIGMREAVQQTAGQVHKLKGEDIVSPRLTPFKYSRVTLCGIYEAG